MIGSALGLAVLLAVLVVGWRKARIWRREGRRPGRNEDNPIAVADYGEIDAALLREQCQCGGRFSIRGEGSRGQLRVVHLECHLCERERVVYFDVRGVRH
ncbi:MAG: hypothetical protein HYR72_19435 [Deltaproteobacteria bacterium]|nr:hypothetical protein [Deltaproteobacteria bacterium]MBI3387279.1 hypothetical protein [Deltaproteobacteria bacterium]